MATSAKTTLIAVRRAALLAALAAVMLGVPWAHAADAPALDPEPEVLVQPKSVARMAVTRMDWVGSLQVAGDSSPTVIVERMRGPAWIGWVTEAREDRGELLLANKGDGNWSARWQPIPDTPEGNYRIRIEGTRQGPDGVTDYELVSKDFSVTACGCVLAGPLRAHRRHGTWRLRVVGRYDVGSLFGFRLLPVRVKTGSARVRVLRDGHEIDRLRLYYGRTAFTGKWRGSRGTRNQVVFELISLRDRFGNF